MAVGPLGGAGVSVKQGVRPQGKRQGVAAFLCEDGKRANGPVKKLLLLIKNKPLSRAGSIHSVHAR